MEKRISYSQFQSVKSVAKAIDPVVRKMAPLRKKIEELAAEYKAYQTQVDALEAGIVSIIGFHTADLVKKVIEPTGKTDANGKPLMVTKYLPTDIVSYDEQKKQYVVSLPEENTQESASENTQGADNDIDTAPFANNEVEVSEEEEEPTPISPIHNSASFE